MITPCGGTAIGVKSRGSGGPNAALPLLPFNSKVFVHFRLSLVSICAVPFFSITAGAARATTIVSVTGPLSIGFVVGNSSSLAATWSQANTYSDVMIAARLHATFPDQASQGDAYLTTRIGPGTTSADEIARSHFMTIPGERPLIPLFSNLTLGPGNYFLTLGSTFNMSPVPVWDNTEPAIVDVAVDTGVNLGPRLATLGSIANSYPPSSSFVSVSQYLIFTVTGTPTAIPEPASRVLLGLGLCGSFCVRGFFL